MPTDKYIIPITKVHSTFTEAKQFYERFRGISFFDDVERLSIKDLATGRRNIIVGEPGVGKSMLLARIKKQLIEEGYFAEIIGLKLPDAVNQIDSFLNNDSTLPKAILLDALDEVKSGLFLTVLQKIEKIASEYPDLAIFLSSRWVFINRHAQSFPEYRFITISPFTRDQVREYLLSSNQTDKDIDVLLDRMSFNHRLIVLQIPRYLSYLEDFIAKEGVQAATEVSRNELFDYFIYSKLELEDANLNTEKRTLIKRLLEKIALVMEIYQTNLLSKDELMTFFDEINSDLKLLTLSQVPLEVFFEKSLLKNNEDAVEFDNTEFQEYLAAKELSRFPDPNRAAADFAIDPEAKETHPSWFNALTFLADMQPDLPAQLIDFSGLRAKKFRLVDETFLTFLSRIDTRQISVETKRQLFLLILDYHQRTLQWLPGQLATTLPNFYEPAFEADLKKQSEASESEKGANHFVPIGNVVYIVAHLLKLGKELDRAYWRGKLIQYASDKNENGVLQRHALLALVWLKDPKVIDEVPDLTTADDLIRRGFLNLCSELDPENPKSVNYFIEAIKHDDFHGRYGIHALKSSASIRRFLTAYNTDELFRREFVKGAGLFGDRDIVIVENIAAVLDEDIRELCKEALVRSVNYNIAHEAEHSSFIVGLWKVLRKGDPGFVIEMVNRIKQSEEGHSGLYFANRFFAEILEEEDVPTYIAAMIDAGERFAAASAMSMVRLSKRLDAEEIYEAGRQLLADEYGRWEDGSSQIDKDTEQRNKELLQKFQTLLEPVPGKFSNSVFEFYNENAESIDKLISVPERARLADLITGTIFKYVDPLKHKLTITEQHKGSTTFTTNSSVFVFGHALLTAKRLGIDVTPFRQHLLNFIPFAYQEELKTIFELVKDIRPDELKAVMEMYATKDSDLWRHMPSSFIEAVEKYHVVGAAPVLKGLVKESVLGRHIREQALVAGDALAPDKSFLQEIFDLYGVGDNDDEKQLASIANAILITSHEDVAAIEWRMEEIVRRAMAFIRPKGGHGVTDLEEELHFGKKFAQPLMRLKRFGYEGNYLRLMENAMSIYANGKDFHEYAAYLWDIVYAYFDNLKDGRTYGPLRLLEDKISEMKDRDGANWLASRMVRLRQSYLAHIGKPRTVSEAVNKYNAARARDINKIHTSEDLFRQLQNALETDLRRWIEGEGAYELIIGEKVFKGKKQQYEKLIQKTLKTQIENILIKRGFNIDIIREPQLMDEKRTDFFIRYGFVGPVVIEVKLTSSTDLKGSKIHSSPSYFSMKRYMEGYGASHGILLVLDNIKAKNLQKVKQVFQGIPNVAVHTFECYRDK